MIEDMRRGLWTFLLLYVLVGIIYVYTVENLALNLVLSAVAVGLACYLYFRKAEAGWKNGLVLSVFYILAAIVFDAVFIFVTYLTEPSALGAFWELYLSLEFAGGLVIMLVVGALTGKYME